MRRPRSRALLVGLLALSVLSLSVQHALYLCGASEHGAAEARSTPAGEAHAGCHDRGSPSTSPEGGSKAPACCGAVSLASLPSGREAVASEALGAPLPLHATTWSAVTLVAAAEATLRRPALDSRREPARLRPHLALRKILV